MTADAGPPSHLAPSHPRDRSWPGVNVRARAGTVRTCRPGEVLEAILIVAVEDEDGRRFWLYRRGDGRDPATGGLRWFLHGLF